MATISIEVEIVSEGRTPFSAGELEDATSIMRRALESFGHEISGDLDVRLYFATDSTLTFKGEAEL